MLPVYLQATPLITLEPICSANEADLGWIQDIVKYLHMGELLEDGKQVHELRIQATYFTLINDHLYRQ